MDEDLLQLIEKTKKFGGDGSGAGSGAGSGGGFPAPPVGAVGGASGGAGGGGGAAGAEGFDSSSRPIGFEPEVKKFSYSSLSCSSNSYLHFIIGQFFI